MAVVTVTATVMDGQVVRWYRDVRDAETHRPVLSASRHGVAVHAEYLTGIPDPWVEAARAVHRALAADPDADIRDRATHRHRGYMNGPLEAVPTSEKG